MKRINKIMVAVDFSEHSIAAAEYAADLARDVAEKILLINVINERDIEVMSLAVKRVAVFSVEDYVDEKIKMRNERLSDLAKKIKNDNLDVKTHVRTGVPYKALLEEIEEEKPDLFVMATKGRSNIADTIIGSCAQKMFRRCPIPLLIPRKDQPVA